MMSNRSRLNMKSETLQRIQKLSEKEKKCPNEGHFSYTHRRQKRKYPISICLSLLFQKRKGILFIGARDQNRRSKEQMKLEDESLNPEETRRGCLLKMMDRSGRRKGGADADEDDLVNGKGRQTGAVRGIEDLQRKGKRAGGKWKKVRDM
ncbi:hypothetical protein L5515_008784 [Caenorhabditis briggsae]|uniref:Uncharacterized protein n=2 Tax=Caenorhabditis briggsae TaxID=6238 RepID=A0AAE9F8J3_CAEBR|nr:hypothetical protein L5515_008784 [Caenorhabditis briggsae]